MSEQSKDDSTCNDTGDDGAADAFDPLFGEIEGVRYFVTDEDEPYAVAIENVNEVRLTVIYEVTPDRGVPWIFRLVDSAMWGDAMWANNEDVVDVAESASGTCNFGNGRMCMLPCLKVIDVRRGT